MKKIILGMVFVFASVAMVNAKNELIDNKTVKVEIAPPPPNCWAGADASEVYSCGSVGCDFDLWAAVYSACMQL
jgi:hypothetical protein